MSPDRDRRLSQALLDWYAESKRDLPWRADPTPYRIMLSEFMLQQTRVDTAIEYYDRFVRRWPRLVDLASTEEEEVVQAWAGLGYYSRARNLHRCAVAAHAAGGIPDQVSDLKKLPGIGPYTAGAIASIGFQRPAAVVDGNVERVLSRVDGVRANPRSSSARRALWARAEALLVAEHPGDFNQGLMELGALVCTPKNPKCGDCPWTELCRAREEGLQEILPAIPKRAKPTNIYAAYGLLSIQGKQVLGRRPPTGILAGMWEPVGTDWTEEDRRDDTDALVAAVNARTGLCVEVGDSLGDVIHVFSHRRLRARVYALRLAEGIYAPRSGKFYSEIQCTTEPLGLGLSKLSRKLFELGDG